MGATASRSWRLFSRNSLDCFDRYERQAVAIEVLLQGTNHHFEELVKGSDLDITNPTALLVDRSLAPYDLPPTTPKGAREVFSQEMICVIGRATPRSPQRCSGKTGCSFYSRKGGSSGPGFESARRRPQTSCTCVPGRSDPRL